MQTSKLRKRVARNHLAVQVGTMALKLLGRDSRSTAEYWERRYQRGGTSGAGSVGPLAQYKAEILQQIVADHEISSVIEFGCGDGDQLSLANYQRYIGLDVAPMAIRTCKEKFSQDVTKSFYLFEPTCFTDHHQLFRAEMAMSLDVIYHLVEDNVYESYMQALFSAAEKLVVIYSSNQQTAERFPHVRHRVFADWVEQNASDWTLAAHYPNPYGKNVNAEVYSPADFYVYKPKHLNGT